MLKKILSKIMKNDLGFDPNKWFDNPRPEEEEKEDLAPSSYEPPVDNRWAPPERRAELEAELNPRPEEDMAEWFSDKKEKPDESDEIEEEKTMHQKMYEIATAKYNPFSVGGSENLGGGSEEIQK